MPLKDIKLFCQDIDAPDVSAKILKWIENANVFQESLETTIQSLNHDTI